MLKKLRVNRVIGFKQILKYVCNLGVKEYYKCKCTICGTENTFERNVIFKQRKQGCRKCATSKDMHGSVK